MIKNINVKIIDARIGKEFPLPTYSTVGSSGLDLRACINKKIQLMPNKCCLVSSGIAIYIENPLITAIILPRSGLGHKQGIVLGNLVGLIDSDYQGELMVSIWNRSDERVLVSPGDRIAQIVFIPIIKVNFSLVNSFKPSFRGKNGLGHSGKK